MEKEEGFTEVFSLAAYTDMAEGHYLQVLSFTVQVSKRGLKTHSSHLALVCLFTTFREQVKALAASCHTI